MCFSGSFQYVSPVGGYLLVHVLVLVLVRQAVHVLVSPEVGSAGPINYQVRAGAALQTVRVVPKLELTSVSHDQGLGVDI